jgi:hypothetical protein
VPEDIPRVPIFLYDRPVLYRPSGPRNARPMGSGCIEEADIDMAVIPDFLEFGRGVVRDKDEVNLDVRVHCVIRDHGTPEQGRI